VPRVMTPPTGLQRQHHKPPLRRPASPRPPRVRRRHRCPRRPPPPTARLPPGWLPRRRLRRRNGQHRVDVRRPHRPKSAEKRLRPQCRNGPTAGSRRDGACGGYDVTWRRRGCRRKEFLQQRGQVERGSSAARLGEHVQGDPEGLRLLHGRLQCVAEHPRAQPLARVHPARKRSLRSAPFLSAEILPALPQHAESQSLRAAMRAGEPIGSCAGRAPRDGGSRAQVVQREGRPRLRRVVHEAQHLRDLGGHPAVAGCLPPCPPPAAAHHVAQQPLDSTQQPFCQGRRARGPSSPEKAEAVP